MKKICLLVSMLLISTTMITVSENTQKLGMGDDSFQEFSLDAYAGGFQPWRTLRRIVLDETGQGIYFEMLPGDRDTGLWTKISSFTLTQNQIDQVLILIQSSNFDQLNEVYNNPFADGTFANMTITMNGESHTVVTKNSVVRPFDVIIRKLNELTPDDMNLYYNAIFNIAPDKPGKPNGPDSGKVGKTLTYSTKTKDYNKDQIYYKWDWGDGTTSEWIGPYESGEESITEQVYAGEGNYQIRVKAKDENDVESPWSDPLSVSLPKGKYISYQNFIEIINSFVEKFPRFHFLLFFFKQPSPTFTSRTLQDINDSGTRVTRDGCDVTVDIYIQISGPCASDDVADDIEDNVEDVWNSDNDGDAWFIPCIDDCERQDPGCSVTFDCHVEHISDGEYLEGYHNITIVCDDSDDGDGHISFVWGNPGLPQPNDGTTTNGTWDTNEPDNTFAHEVGHLMGLDDEYHVVTEDPYVTQPNAGHEQDIMANLSGSPLQDAINEIVVNDGGIECPCECCPEEDEEEPISDIISPEDGATVSSPLNVTGEATDAGSGIVELDFTLDWDEGTYEGDSYFFDPPEPFVEFTLGPLFLEDYLDPEDEELMIRVFAIDAAGNVGFDEVTVFRSTTEDTIPPITVKEIGQPNSDGGYVVSSYTPIWLNATDNGTGVQFIYYEMWWDSNEDMVVDTLMGTNTVYDDTAELHFEDFGIFFGIAELRWYAVDNAGNQETMHIQEHFVQATN